MSDFEVLILLISLTQSGIFFFNWFYSLFRIWPPSRVAFAKIPFIILPILAFIIFFITVKYLASFDVVTSGIYQMFYIVLGFAWLSLSLTWMHLCLGLSWKDDILHINNKAALPAIAGGFIANCLIYAGANIGDGPGWWCVVVAGGIGLFIFLFVGVLIHKLTGVIEKITIERNTSTGIRMGMFFLAIGIILARASGGDWISLSQTINDFWVAWPLIPLTILALIVEWSLKLSTSKLASFIIGLIYLGIAIGALFILPPLPQNPIYASLLEGFII